MNPSTIKDEIINLLEDIISRTNYISHHHPGKDLSLDIDLVKDDIRVLYSYFEKLKNLAADRSPLYPKVEAPKEEADANPAKVETESALAPEEADATQSEIEAGHALAPEAVENQASSGDTGIQSSIMEELEKPGEEKAETDKKEDEKQSEADNEMMVETHVDQSFQTKPASLETLESKQKETQEETGVKAEKETAQKETPVSNGKKSVIDLLSSYSQKTIGDQYAQADNSLNKRISGDREDNSIGAKMQLNPISNIKEVIGLNEKFLFINELFSGNIQEYHDAIASLNAMENMQSAFDYLNKLSEKYSWDADRSTATINKLATYVQRRYM